MSESKKSDAASEAEIAAMIAAEAQATAAQAEEQAAQAVAEVEKLSAQEAEAAVVAARKDVARREAAVAKARQALKESVAECDAAIEMLEKIRPPLSTMQIIQKHNAEMRERNLINRVVNPIDRAGAQGPSPFQI